MRKLNLIPVVIVLSMFLLSCTKEEKDREKIVEMTVYPETRYSGNVLSDIWSDVLIISDSDDTEKRELSGNITEGLDYDDYEKGYEYKYKVKKVWMHNPPQDVSSIKYIFLELLSKKRVITENSEKDMRLYVLPQRVEYRPRISTEYVDGMLQSYNALHVKDESTGYWMALIDIKGFDFEAGNEYVINVKEVTQADPYSQRYTLLDVVSKEKSNKRWPGVVYRH